jgi:hypothetical protein
LSATAALPPAGLTGAFPVPGAVRDGGRAAKRASGDRYPQRYPQLAYRRQAVELAMVLATHPTIGHHEAKKNERNEKNNANQPQ